MVKFMVGPRSRNEGQNGTGLRWKHGGEKKSAGPVKTVLLGEADPNRNGGKEVSV